MTNLIAFTGVMNEDDQNPMNVQTQISAAKPATTEHFDVVIAGAGISGVGAAYHLTTQCPGTSFVALETQKTFGGTWSTHRYPGIRSDSDLHTFGYRFKPWTISADRDRRRDPQIYGRGDRGERSRPPHPLSAHHHLGEMVERGEALDHRGGQSRHRRGGSLHHQFLLDVPGLLPPHRGLYARVEGHGPVQGADRASAEHGPRTSTTRTSA